MTNEDTTDFDEHFAKISSYIVDTLHGVPLEMTEDEKEQFRMEMPLSLQPLFEAEVVKTANYISSGMETLYIVHSGISK